MTLVEAKGRGMKVIGQHCTSRESARMRSGPDSGGSFNGGVESVTVAADSGGTSRRRSSRSVKALHERNANLGCRANAEKLTSKPLRRSPRFETQKADCGFPERIQKRRSPRLIAAVSQGGNKENEGYRVHSDGLVRLNVVEERVREREAKGNRDGTSLLDLRKSPTSPPHNVSRRFNNENFGSVPKRRSPRFIYGASDEGKEENEQNVVSEKETKNSIGQSGSRERTENPNIVSEKFTRNEGVAGRKRSASSDLLKDEGGEKKLGEYNGSQNKEICVELEIKHHGYHDDSVKRKSETPLGSFGFLGWSQDQEKALERAYLITRPSLHFWREIAKLVPGKSAKECFDRIHSIIPTPPTQQPRSRTKGKLSPLGQFNLTGNVSFEQFGLKGQISGKRKSLFARRAVRHILRKHVLADQGCVSGLLSGLEGSCSTDQDLSQKRKLTVQNNKLKSHCLEMNGESEPSGSRNKMPSFVTPFHQQALASPEILKKVKNLVSHEKYIDRLHIREQTRGRKAAIKRTYSVPAETKGGTLDKTETIKYARLALVSDARDVLKRIQQESHETETLSEYDGFNDDDDNDNSDCDSGFEIC